MFISHLYKFIFIKTRKTAGSSIEKFFLDLHKNTDDFVFGGMPPEKMNPVNIKQKKDVEHAGWQWISKSYPSEWKEYYKFTIERNSWDKVVSTYYWQLKNGPWKIKPFNEYIELQQKLFNRGCWQLYTNQNEVIVDSVLQYNSISKDFSVIANRLNIPYNNELENIRLKSSIRKNSSYKNMYNEKTKELVKNSFIQPINYFNYEF